METAKKNTIKPAKLTKSEAGLLEAVGIEKQFIFDVQLTEKSSYLEYWVDHYEKGKKIETLTKGSETGTEWRKKDENKKYKIIFYKESKPDENKKSEDFFISVIDESGYTKMDFEVPVSNQNSGELSVAIQESKQLQVGKPITVGMIIESKDGRIEAQDISHYNSNAEIEKKVKKYDQAYFFRVKLLANK
ncbi:hypothetical protein B4102_0874 [Heyndrickxia sporothermodurans]|uniref:Uncharacterized protein n=1 Tax=Heyndrickxia sporothermodurans TaxID=46224 RepID=A0A150KNI7_9BACI|nr:hypothetical protein [Heyndrickxia sporothermodurans]KYC97219.1 hypothetical protein B4102_0874 [Heyndrickxia sporothermodurans]